MGYKFRKIHAFTLSEMLVVLFITTLVVGLSYSVLNLVQKQMSSMEIHYEKQAELRRLKQALWLDFNLSDRVYWHETTVQLVFDAPLRNGSYEFQANRIIRQQDTFNIGNYEMLFYFENRMTKVGEIDAILLNLKPQTSNPSFAKATEGEPKPQTQNTKLFVFKTNSTTTYMNN